MNFRIPRLFFSPFDSATFVSRNLLTVITVLRWTAYCKQLQFCKKKSTRRIQSAKKSEKRRATNSRFFRRFRRNCEAVRQVQKKRKRSREWQVQSHFRLQLLRQRRRRFQIQNNRLLEGPKQNLGVPRFPGNGKFALTCLQENRLTDRLIIIQIKIKTGFSEQVFSRPLFRQENRTGLKDRRQVLWQDIRQSFLSFKPVLLSCLKCGPEINMSSVTCLDFNLKNKKPVRCPVFL